ncbi:U-box domain-containing protein 40 [Linum grandiflorum]
MIIQDQNDNQRCNLQQQKQRWSIFSSRRSLSWAAASSNSNTTPYQTTTTTTAAGEFIPAEFLCPISGYLMADPTIVSSGHTFDRACLQACYSLGFSPSFPDGSVPDFSAVIPNLALRSTILKWCNHHSLNPPKSLHYSAAQNIVRTKMEQQKQRKLESENRAIGENNLMIARPEILVSSSSGESVSSTGSSGSSLPVQFATRPRCYSSGSSSSSSETDELLINYISNPEEEEELVAKLNSAQVSEVEEAVISLRKLTRTRDQQHSSTIQLCTPLLLSALRSLIASRYTNVQVNSVACVVNLSLEKQNKVKIVRSGILPPLIEVLKGGFAEAQEHAAGAIFSLALDEHNKTAIGVLGALPPLLNLLRSGSERTRDDSASALYHLSLIQSNGSKMVRIGSVGMLLGVLKSGHMTGRVLSILGNLAFCIDGRAAMLDGGGVECLVRRLRIEMESESESGLEENCVSVLCGLSQGGLRFKGLAKAAGAEEVVAAAAERCRGEETREKAKMILEMIKRKAEEDAAEEVDWEEVLEVETQSEFTCKTRCTVGNRRDEASSTCNSF